MNLPGSDDAAPYEVRDARSGDVLWTFEPLKNSDGDVESSSVALDPEGSTVYLLLSSGEMAAQNAATGDTKWSYKFAEPRSGEPLPSLAFADGVVCVTDRATVRAVASDDGSELWTVPLDDTPVGAVLIGRMLLVQTTSHLYAVGLDEERVVWQKRAELSWQYPAGGIVFVTSHDTFTDTGKRVTQALDIDDGAVRWSDPSAPHAVLAERNLVAYADGDGKLLRTRSLDTGKKLYEKAIPAYDEFVSTLVGDVLVEPTRSGEKKSLVGIGLDDGTVRWRKPHGDIKAPDGRWPYGKVLVADSTGKSLRALDPTTGETRWTVTPDDKRSVLEVAQVGKNLLFVSTGESSKEDSTVERLYCLELLDA